MQNPQLRYGALSEAVIMVMKGVFHSFRDEALAMPNALRGQGSRPCSFSLSLSPGTHVGFPTTAIYWYT